MFVRTPHQDARLLPDQFDCRGFNDFDGLLALSRLIATINKPSGFDIQFKIQI